MSQNTIGIFASQISGHLWEPQGAYDALSTITLSATTASITFAGIPNTYKHLQIRCLVKTTLAGNPSAMGIQFNSTTTGYFHHGLYGDGASAAAYSATSSTFAGSSYIAGTSATNVFGVSIIDILDYASTDKNKTVRALSGADFNGSGQVRLSSGSVASTSAITSLTLFDANAASLSQYSQFTLYGVR